jgi:hypothetical protein
VLFANERLNELTLSAVIFFSGIIVPDFNERLYREQLQFVG